MKKSDPFASLGLEWGATATEIKDAYRRMARELHPDVTTLDPTVAANQFRLVRDAYDKLMNKNDMLQHRTDIQEDWSFKIWRNGDLIAQERTDVAGTMRKRPVKPAESIKGSWGGAVLGHPTGRGRIARGEYLTNNGDFVDRKRSSTVGSGKSKWVKQKKEFRPWSPDNATTMKGVSSQYRKK